MRCPLRIEPGSLRKPTHSSPCISAVGPRRAGIFNGSTRITLHFSAPQCFISPLFCWRTLIFPTYFLPITCSFRHILQHSPGLGGRREGAGGEAGRQALLTAFATRRFSDFHPLRDEAAGSGGSLPLTSAEMGSVMAACNRELQGAGSWRQFFKLPTEIMRGCF